MPNPISRDQLAKWSAKKAAHLLRAGELSSRDLVEASIAAIEEVQPQLNALVEDRFALARGEALAADELWAKTISKTDLPELHGVPFTCKEMFSVAGMKSTFGLSVRSHQRQKEDASVVTRLRRSGGVLLGTTNVPELGFWFETFNQVYGTTNNPYDLTRTPGGSSGGEAALIASGASLLGIGSDVGGSIRIPSAFCGIFGHKPSLGVIPMTGHPVIERETAHLFSGTQYPITCAGPMSRFAEDIEWITQLLKGPDGIDPETSRIADAISKARWRDLKSTRPEVDPRKWKVYLLSSPRVHGASPTEECLQNSVLQAARYMEQLGCEVVELPADFFASALGWWQARMADSSNKSLRALMEAPMKSLPRELFDLAFQRSTHTLPIVIATWLEATIDSSPTQKRVVQKQREELRAFERELYSTLGNNSVVLLPTHPRRAFRHGEAYTRPFDFTYTGIANALGYPATHVPTGLIDGLPVGVQVIAGPLQDTLCFEVAELLQSAFGGYAPPEN